MSASLVRKREICQLACVCLGSILRFAAPGVLGAQQSAANQAGGMTGETAQGQALLQQQAYAQAMDHFEAALRTAATDRVAHQGEVKTATAWALKLIAARQPNEAMNVLVRGLQALPKDPELLTDFGIEATALGQYPIADQALRAANELRPHEPKTVYGLARLEVQEDHLADAERDLKAYLVLQPEDASAYFGLGHVYAMQQKGDAARVAFQRSIALKPTQSESYYQLGQLDLEAHQDAEAQQSFETVLTRVPQHAGALTGLGEIALRAKDYAKAEQYLLAAEQSDPAYHTPHYFRGLALAKLGRKQEADEELRKGDSRQHVTTPPEGAPSGAQPSTGGPAPPAH